MSEQQNRPALPDDEFDIEVLAGKLWRIQKKFWIKLFYPFKVLLVNPKRLAVTLIASILVAVVLRFTIPPQYRSGFIIKPNNLGDIYFLAMLHDIDILLQDKNYPAIARNLGITETNAMELTRVELNPIFKNDYRRDTITAAEVVLTMRDANLIDTFQNGILYHYLEKNPYYKKAQEIRGEQLKAMEERLSMDLKENDSLKKVLTANAFPRGNGGFVFGEPIDPVKVYESGFSVYQKYLEVKSSREYNSSFELVKPGIVRIRPYFPKLIILLPVTVFIGLVICLIINLRKEEIR